MEKVTLSNKKEFEEKLKSIEFMKAETLSELVNRKRLQNSLKDNGIEGFKELTDFNQISFGHFILTEKILNLEGVNMDKRIELLAPVILRPLDEEWLDNSDLERENAHKKAVLEYELGSVMGAVNRYLELRKTYLFKTYNGVIYDTMYEGDSPDDEEEEGTNVNSSQSAREFHTKRFFWNIMISELADGNIFHFDKVVELPMFQVMPYLAQKRSQQIVENLEAKARR